MTIEELEDFPWMAHKKLTKMRFLTAAGLLTASACLAPFALAADDPQFQRMALCQDSWLDWRSDDARISALVDYFEARLERNRQGDGATPRSPIQVLGYSVVQAYPQSVGMGVGFSLVINADFAQALAAVEHQLGKPMMCSTSDGLRSCELHLGNQRTAMVITGERGNAKTSLVGCYYYYEK